MPAEHMVKPAVSLLSRFQARLARGGPRLGMVLQPANLTAPFSLNSGSGGHAPPARSRVSAAGPPPMEAFHA